MKIDKQWILDNRLWIELGGVVMAVLILFAYLSWPGPKPPDIARIINEATIAAKKPLLEQIETQKIQNAEAKAKVAISEGKYKVLVGKYNDLQKEKINVKPAQTDKEMVARYSALGFTPVPPNWTGGGIICFPTGYSK
jgi:hypothetical protein